MTVTKNYVDAIAMGMTMCASKPTSPVPGDAYYDAGQDRVYVFATNKWHPMSATKSEPATPIVTIEEVIDIYPDLKDLADKYMEWEILKRTGNNK